MRILLAAALTLGLNASAHAAERINYDTVGCISDEDFSRAGELGRSGDEKAWKKFVTQKVNRGQCAILKAGDQVFLEDFSLFSGIACVRPEGETECLIIEYEAIQKSN